MNGLRGAARSPNDAAPHRHRPPADPPDAVAAQSAVEDLVSRAQSGEEEAFAALYRRCAPQVSRYLTRRIRDPLAVEDLTSETFLRVLRRIGTFHWQGRAFEAWVLTIARNLATDHQRALVLARNRPDADLPGQRPSPSAEDEALTQIFQDGLEAILDGLTPPQRECLRLRLIADLSVDETARIMGRTTGAVKTLHYRARKKVSERICADYGVPPQARSGPGPGR
ncbi:sigma-70 family RNA polymerase sigma factor [Kitasatospora sp. NPDC088346]|uniref:sigma-70 family RNA polymerase sigma factor n=1 Tax=Kitasatospora sp. NPDC088346 TaxID=3364073 RepID=UPI003825D273